MENLPLPFSTDVAGDGVTTDPAATVRSFVFGLVGPYRRLRDVAGGVLPDGGSLDDRLAELLLAEAALRFVCSPGSDDNRPPQLAVLGPTQTGKSTLVNMLLGRNVAEVSPLAGFTVHPQGFWLDAQHPKTEWLTHVFPDWQRCEPDELTRDELAVYALSLIDSSMDSPATLPSCVVWDTPDFDSLAAHSYQRGVLEVAALADAYLLVLSKEKYSDLLVWRMLRLLAPLKRPLVICLNKLTPDAADAVITSLRQRLAEMGGEWGDVPIIPVEYRSELSSSPAADLPQVAVTLRGQLSDCLPPAVGQRESHRLRIQTGVRELIRRHWADWTAPLLAEHAALTEWNTHVEQVLTRFVELYRRDYLDHPQRYDSFRRAAVELLNLLEIPKLSGWMTRAREVATWPARQLLLAGRSWWSQRRGKDARGHQLGSEAAVLFDAIDGLLTSLQRDVARKSDPATPGYAVWRALGRRLQRDEAVLRQTFHKAIEQHHSRVTREVHVAASELYEELKTQPGRLAAVRTARVTIDAGAIVLAVKTGGLTPMDAVWAPAMFGLTSLLMEGVADAQMGHVAKGLKKRQLDAVREGLVNGVLSSELCKLTSELDDEGLFAIPPEQLHEAGRALEAWEQANDG